MENNQNDRHQRPGDKSHQKNQMGDDVRNPGSHSPSDQNGKNKEKKQNSSEPRKQSMGGRSEQKTQEESSQRQPNREDIRDQGDHKSKTSKGDNGQKQFSPDKPRNQDTYKKVTQNPTEEYDQTADHQDEQKMENNKITNKDNKVTNSGDINQNAERKSSFKKAAPGAHEKKRHQDNDEDEIDVLDEPLDEINSEANDAGVDEDRDDEAIEDHSIDDVDHDPSTRSKKNRL